LTLSFAKPYLIAKNLSKCQNIYWLSNKNRL
jgi:hypothetical protein